MLWALPLVFVKEDQGFTVAALGVLMIVISLWRDDARPSVRTALIGGQFLVAWGIAWSVLAIAVIIPHFNAAHQYLYWGDGGTLGPGSSFGVGSTVRQFVTAWPTKLQTMLMLLLPTAFIALWSPLALIALPSIVLRFLATSANFWGTQYHYNATACRSCSSRPSTPSSGSGRRSLTRTVRPAGPLAAKAEASRTALATTIGRHGAAAMLAIAAALVFQFPLGGLWCRAPTGSARTRPTCERGHSPGARRRDRHHHAGPAGAAGRAHGHVLDRQQRLTRTPSTSCSTAPTAVTRPSRPTSRPSWPASTGRHYQVIYDAGDVYVFH